MVSEGGRATSVEFKVKGLDEVTMLKSFEKMQVDKPGYNFYTKNCTDVVEGLLKQGGASYLANPQHVVNSPSDLGDRLTAHGKIGEIEVNKLPPMGNK